MATPWIRSPRAVTTVAVATLGLGLNLRAWVLLGPRVHGRYDLGVAGYVLLVSLPILVTAVVRLPVGVLTDRYGARVMFPVVSLAAAASAFGLGFANSLTALVIAGGAAGVAGTAFVVGGSLLSRTLPYGRRGLALGVFSLGPTLSVLTSAVSWGFDPGGRRAALVLGVLLVGFAGLAALVLRDPVAVRRVGSPVRRCLEIVRLASATSLSLLYAIALGGLVSIAVYLPVYLSTDFGMEWFHALAVTGTVVGLAAVARLVGGWWTDRRPTAGLLKVCYAVAAFLCLIVALEPRLTAPVIAAVAICDGVASGALLALIGKSAQADSTGAIMGATSTAAALGALLPALMLIGIPPATAWILLAATMLGVALYVREHGLRVGLGLAVRFEPEPTPAAMTVTVVGESDAHVGAAAVVTRLARLATSDELVVVYGSDGPRVSVGVLVAGLRYRLPRYSVESVDVRPPVSAHDPLAAQLGGFVEAGTLAIAATPTVDLLGVTAELSSYLHADRVLMLSYSPATGADLHEVWTRDDG